MEQLIASAGVFVAEFYGNFVGGGSILTQFVLQGILGMGIKQAMALDNFAAYGSVLGMFFILFKDNYKLKLSHFIIFTLMQTSGSFLGAKSLVFIDKTYLELFFILSIVLVLINNFIKINIIIKLREIDKSILFAIVAFVIGFYNGLFVVGDWVIALLLLNSVLRLSYHNAIFLLLASSLLASPVSLYIYVKSGLIDFSYATPMFASTILGGILSAKILKRIDSEKMKKALKIFGLILAVYLFIDILLYK